MAKFSINRPRNKKHYAKFTVNKNKLYCIYYLEENGLGFFVNSR